MKNGKQTIFFVLFSIVFVSMIFAILILIAKLDLTDADIGSDGEYGYDPSLPTVIIDPGHGGEDGGAVGKNGISEKELNLALSNELCVMLRSSGYRVVMTRTEDKMLYDPKDDYHGRKKQLDLNARVNIAQEYKNAIFVSIHMNTFPDGRYSGLQVYYSNNSYNGEASLELAESIQSSVSGSLQKNNQRKVKPSAGNIFILEKIHHPAILIECGFISNQAECELLCDGDYRKDLALAVFCGINRYISKVGT